MSTLKIQSNKATNRLNSDQIEQTSGKLSKVLFSSTGDWELNNPFGIIDDWGLTTMVDSSSNIHGFDELNATITEQKKILENKKTEGKRKDCSKVNVLYKSEKEVVEEITPRMSSLLTEIPQFPAYLIEFFEEEESEELDQSKNYKHELKLLREYEKYNRTQSNSVPSYSEDGKSYMTWEGEGYEKVRPKFYNKGFKHFQNTVARNPEQIIRYEFNGTPLFYATDSVSIVLLKSGVPNCPHCNAQRVFEFQLMPAILSLFPTEQMAAIRMQENDITKLNEKINSPLSDLINKYALGMEFGTLMVFTCSNDCLDEGEDNFTYFEEHIAIQLESWK
ncbi:programmed cell death protein [Nowakowskiella sp. JEL0078]|nr:programmed cell death protein [Nowakowskiella sp. JEL0078]